MSNRQERMESLFCSRLRKPFKSFYDIGVGIGTEYLTIARYFPSVSIYGCEPDPNEFSRLAKDFPGKLLQAAIGPADTKTLYQAKEGSGGSTMMSQYGGGKEPIQVNVISLDEFDAWAGYPDGIVVWMDIEGSEERALESGTKLLQSGRVEYLNLEVRDEPFPGCPSAKSLEHLLSEFGYVLDYTYNCQVTHRDAVYKKRKVK